jgi:hypothetical protein
VVEGYVEGVTVAKKRDYVASYDNVAAINIANNPIRFDHTKHVEIDRFFIKEKIDMRVLKLEYISLVIN